MPAADSGRIRRVMSAKRGWAALMLFDAGEADDGDIIPLIRDHADSAGCSLAVIGTDGISDILELYLPSGKARAFMPGMKAGSVTRRSFSLPLFLNVTPDSIGGHPTA